jgi:formylglycine-generating enzyme required for sulfatase activity
MIKIPGQNFEMSKTEITQELYKSVMGENPSRFKGANNPVECVSWYDAIWFCNKLSVAKGYEPVYSVDGNTDITKWNYTPHQWDSIEDEITQNSSANGYRLPTVAEWGYAAKGGRYYNYAGSNEIDEVAWYDRNSNDKTHSVAQKKANGYGLYDMSGNVEEWCWDSFTSQDRYSCGGSWRARDYGCKVSCSWTNAHAKYDNIGFRIVRSVK